MSEPLTTINEIWKIYQAEVLPKTAGKNQVTESKRAFFAGAQGLFMLLTQQIAALPEDEAEKVMKSLEKQFQGFAEAVQQGAA